MRLLIAPILWAIAPHPAPAAPCAAATASPSAFVVVERRDKRDTLATVTICLVSDPARLRLAGYHGELQLPRSHKVVKVNRPAGGTRIENATSPGRVSFAGVAAEGLTSGPVLQLTVSRHGSGDDGRIRLAMLDLTDVNGRDVVAQVAVDSMPRILR